MPPGEVIASGVLGRNGKKVSPLPVLPKPFCSLVNLKYLDSINKITHFSIFCNTKKADTVLKPRLCLSVLVPKDEKSIRGETSGETSSGSALNFQQFASIDS